MSSESFDPHNQGPTIEKGPHAGKSNVPDDVRERPIEDSPRPLSQEAGELEGNIPSSTEAMNFTDEELALIRAHRESLVRQNSQAEGPLGETKPRRKSLRKRTVLIGAAAAAVVAGAAGIVGASSNDRDEPPATVEETVDSTIPGETEVVPAPETDPTHIPEEIVEAEPTPAELINDAYTEIYNTPIEALVAEATTIEGKQRIAFYSELRLADVIKQDHFEFTPSEKVLGTATPFDTAEEIWLQSDTKIQAALAAMTFTGDIDSGTAEAVLDVQACNILSLNIYYNPEESLLFPQIESKINTKSPSAVDGELIHKATTWKPFEYAVPGSEQRTTIILDGVQMPLTTFLVQSYDTGEQLPVSFAYLTYEVPPSPDQSSSGEIKGTWLQVFATQ